MWYNNNKKRVGLIFNIDGEFEALTNLHQKVYVF